MSPGHSIECRDGRIEAETAKRVQKTTTIMTRQSGRAASQGLNNVRGGPYPARRSRDAAAAGPPALGRDLVPQRRFARTRPPSARPPYSALATKVRRALLALQAPVGSCRLRAQRGPGGPGCARSDSARRVGRRLIGRARAVGGGFGRRGGGGDPGGPPQNHAARGPPLEAQPCAGERLRKRHASVTQASRERYVSVAQNATPRGATATGAAGFCVNFAGLATCDKR
eukprot:1189439-Prorocentrum_minimum.AAC.4